MPAAAYERFAIQAFDLFAVDYLLKPFARERLHLAVARLRERRQGGVPGNEGLEDFLRAHDTRLAPARLVVKDGEAVLVTPMHEIDWCEADVRMVLSRTHRAAVLSRLQRGE